MTATLLHPMLDESARRRPEHPAVEELSGSAICYADLAVQSDRLRDRLAYMGVSPGDRVGICLRKSADAITAMFGVLKAGAAYVPVDAAAPARRNGYIFSDCTIKIAIVEEQFAEPLRDAMTELGCSPSLVITEGSGGGKSLENELSQLQQTEPAPPIERLREFDR